MSKYNGTPRAEGKKVAEFLYQPKDALTGTVIRIPVYMVQQVDREKVYSETERKRVNPGRTTHVTFAVKLREPKEIHIRSTDIEVLHAAVFSELDKALSLKWVRYLYVAVDKPSVFTGSGEGVDITYEEVDIAQCNGIEVYRQIERSYRVVREGRPYVGGARGDRQYSLIEATDVNVAALKAFLSRVKTLREQTAEFLGQKKIATSLAQLGQKLLPEQLPMTRKRREI